MSLQRAKRLLAGGGAVKAVRNFFTGITGSNLDRVLEDLKTQRAGGADVAQANAMDRWVDRNLRNYLIRQHGTEDDPLRALVSDDPEGMPSHAITTTPAANLYAKMAGDPTARVPHPKDQTAWLHRLASQDWPRYQQEKQYNSRYFNLLSEAKTPEEKEAALKELDAQTQARNNPPINLHDIDRHVWASHYQPKLEDTLDYLRTLDPRSLAQVSVPDAVRKSNEWHAAMAKAAGKAQLDAINGLPIVKQYPNGAKWVAVDKDASDEQKEALQQIGKSLGHCYQNPDTCQHYLEGSTLHTLIDPSGKPRVTVEAGEYRAPFPGAPVANLRDIEQIRGPQNGDAPEDAVPYLKDFIGSQPFGDVADADRYGLKKYTTQGGYPRWLDPEVLPKDFARYRFNGDNGPQLMSDDDWVKATVDRQLAKYPPQAQKGMRAGAEAAARRQLGDFSSGTYSIPDNYSPVYDLGHADGGVVHADNGYDELKQRAQDLKGRVVRDSDPQPPWWALKHYPVDAAMNGTLGFEVPDWLIDADHIGHVPDHPGVPYPTPGRRIAMAGGGLADLASDVWRSLQGAKSERQLYEEAVAREAAMRAKITQRKLAKTRERLQENLRQFGRTPAQAAQTTDVLLQGPPNESAAQSREVVHKGLDAQDAVNHAIEDYDSTISDTEDQYGIPHGLLRRLVRQESNFDPNAVSKAGAVGIMQFMPATAASMGIDPTDPSQAIPAGGEYLRKLYDKFGSWKAALAGYNWGPGNVEKHGLGHLPPETQKYVKAILGFQPDGEPIAPGPAGAIQTAKAQTEAAQAAVPRETAVIAPAIAKRLTGYATSDKVPSIGQDNKALLALLLSDDDEDIDPLASLFEIEGVDGPEGANP